MRKFTLQGGSASTNASWITHHRVAGRKLTYPQHSLIIPVGCVLDGVNMESVASNSVDKSANSFTLRRGLQAYQ